MSQGVPNLIANIVPDPGLPHGAPRNDLEQSPPLRSIARGWFGADRMLCTLTQGSAAIVLLMMAALVIVLTVAAIPSMKAFGAKFLVGTTWRPNELELI